MTTTKAQRCVSCGAVDSITPTTPSRTTIYRSVLVTLPPLSLPECASCHDMLLDDAQSDIYSDAIDVAYAAAVAEGQPSWLSILSPSDRALFFKEVAEAQDRGESVDVLIQQWRNTASAVAAGIDLVTPIDPEARSLTTEVKRPRSN
jgi:hypothetical protein